MTRAISGAESTSSAAASSWSRHTRAAARAGNRGPASLSPERCSPGEAIYDAVGSEASSSSRRLSRSLAAQPCGRCAGAGALSNARGGVARVGGEPGRVAPGERGRGQAVQEDREADGEEDRVQQHRLVREVGILDEDHREHDRRQSPRPEPAEEGDRRTPGAGSEHRQGHGNHADEGQAEERIQDDLDGEVVERRHEHDGAEEDERDRTEQAACLFEEVAHLAPDLAAQPAEDGAADEGGDESAAVHPYGQPVGERGPGDRDDLEPRSGRRGRA